MSTPLSHESSDQLFVIGQAVNDYEVLINQLPENIPYLLIDPKRDGLEQLSAELAGMTDLPAIHIISHGAPGRCLGSSPYGSVFVMRLGKSSGIHEQLLITSWLLKNSPPLASSGNSGKLRFATAT